MRRGSCIVAPVLGDKEDHNDRQCRRDELQERDHAIDLGKDLDPIDVDRVEDEENDRLNDEV